MGISYKNIKKDDGQGITLKEVVLFKGTDHKKTSEAFLEVSAQPKNTCPIIDDALVDIKNQQREISSLSCEKPRYYVEKCEECSISEDIEQNESEINSILSEFSSFESSLGELAFTLDKQLRKLCEAYRMYGDEIKELIWGILASESKEDLDSWAIELVNLKKTKPKDWMRENEHVDCYKNFSIRVNPSQSYACKSCDNQTINEKLVTYLENLDSFSATAPSEIEAAFNNLRLLDDWSDQLETIAQDLINKGNINLEQIWTEADYEKYIVERNRKELEKFYGFWSNNIKSIISDLKCFLDKMINVYSNDDQAKIRAKQLGEKSLTIVELLSGQESFIENLDTRSALINAIKNCRSEIAQLMKDLGSTTFQQNPTSNSEDVSSLQKMLLKLENEMIVSVPQVSLKEA
jgi:hypothetical protein